MNIELIKLDVLNKNGRMFTKDSFKEFPKQVPVLNTEPKSLDFNVESIIGTADNFEIKDNKLICKINLNNSFPTPIYFATCGISTEISNNTPIDYQIVSVFATDKPAYTDIDNIYKKCKES